MRVAYFDCIFGVSGDMILGALVGCGVPLEHLTQELEKLNINGFELKSETVSLSGITAVNIDVITEKQHKHRHLSHITEIIGSSDVPEKVKENAIHIFTRLAQAEAKVHGSTVEKVHFHEVGALDAIVDVVGACIGLEYLGVKNVVSSSIRLGTGTVKTEHGLMPVPVPAVVELLNGVPVVRTTMNGEITTPTGSAIVSTLASSYGSVDSFTTQAVGYGAGSKHFEDHPNILRISVGDIPGVFDTDHCILLETNIDDMNPEIYGYVEQKMFEAGAKDVFMSPLYMKKGRPGTLLSVLADDSSYDTIMDLMFKETTTIGVRITHVLRKKLTRDIQTVKTEFGPVRVKFVHVDGNTRSTPEFDDCARIAREKGVPLITVYDAVNKHISS